MIIPLCTHHYLTRSPVCIAISYRPMLPLQEWLAEKPGPCRLGAHTRLMAGPTGLLACTSLWPDNALRRSCSGVPQAPAPCASPKAFPGSEEKHVTLHPLLREDFFL